MSITLYHSNNRLGGVITNERVQLQTATGTLSGVTLGYATNNALGNHDLVFQPPQTALPKIVRIELRVLDYTAANGAVKLQMRLNGVQIDVEIFEQPFINSAMSTHLMPAIENNAALEQFQLSELVASESNTNNSINIGSTAYFDITGVAGVDFTVEDVQVDHHTAVGYREWQLTATVQQPLREASTTNRLRWDDGDWQAVGASGTLILSSTTGSLEVDVDVDNLPTMETITPISIGKPSGNLFSNLSGLEVLDGNVSHRCFYIKNTDSMQHRIKWYLPDIHFGDSTMAIGFDPTGVGDGNSTGVATSIATANDVPSGVTFTQPQTSGDALQVDLPANAVIAAWMQRSITGAERSQLDVVGDFAIEVI